MVTARNPRDGTEIAFSDPDASGQKFPIVLVHGSGLSKAIWRGFGYVHALREEYRVISVDLRGHGRSGKPDRPEDYRMELIVGDVLAVLDAAGIHSAHYFGYSFGARVGFSLIADHPDRIRSFISAGGTYRAPGGSVGELFFPAYDEALAVGGMPEFVSRWGEASGAPVDPQTAAAFLANDARALRAYFRQVENEPGLSDERLRSLWTPTLLLAGTEDRQRYLDSQRAAVLMPDARFQPLDGRDHGHTLQPATGVIEPVLEFLHGIAG